MRTPPHNHHHLYSQTDQQKGKVMLNQIVSYVGTIKEIENRKDLILVTDPLEVRWILDYLGYKTAYDNDPFQFSGLFVNINDGDYEEVFAFEGFVPYLNKNLWVINTKLTSEA